MGIRILIVDDHGVVRQGLRMYLSLDPELEVVGEAANGAEALRLAHELEPDVVLMDLLMPVMDGIAATEAIRRELPDVEVIALTSVLEDSAIYGAMRAGAIGYLLKDTQADELCRSIKAAAAGQVQMSPSVAARLLREVRSPENPEPLTGRETEVLRQLALGKSNKEIAADPGHRRKDGPDPREQHPGQAGGDQPYPGRPPRRAQRSGAAGTCGVTQGDQRSPQHDAERQRAEATLTEREAQYRSVLESTSDGLLVFDLEGKLVDLNPAAARMHGYSVEEFRSLEPSQFVHAGSLPVFEQFIETVKVGRDFHGRARDLRRDGAPFHIEVFGTGFAYGGEPHALAVVRDITEEVEAYQLLEQRVEERTRELSMLLDVSANIASTLDLPLLLEMILEQLQQVVAYDGASVLILEGDELRNVAHRGPIPYEVQSQMHLSREQAGELWEALEGHEHLIIGDVQGDTWLAQAFRQAFGEYLDREMGYVRTWVGVPLMVRERLIGWLSVHHCEPGAYAQHHASSGADDRKPGSHRHRKRPVVRAGTAAGSSGGAPEAGSGVARLGVAGAVRHRPGGAYRQRAVGSRCHRTRIEVQSGGTAGLRALPGRGGTGRDASPDL